jgi:hypothetical protein
MRVQSQTSKGRTRCLDGSGLLVPLRQWEVLMPDIILPYRVDPQQKLTVLLAHAALGRRIFPTAWITGDGKCSCVGQSDGDIVCSRNKPGKHPRISEWQKRATADVDEIREWHSWVPQANWGWLQDSTFALDVDPGRGGLESLAQWEEEAGGPVPTLTQRTPSGGYHFIYWQPDPPLRAEGDILPGIEIRGQGSYIMLDPSSDHRGLWRIQDYDKAPQDADELTLGLILKHGLVLDDGTELRAGRRRQRSGATGDTSDALPATGWFMANGLGGFSGSRNRDAYRLAWRLLRLGDVHSETYTTTRIAGIMKTCWLATDQGESPFPWDECIGALRSAWNRKTRQDKEAYELAMKLAGGR